MKKLSFEQMEEVNGGNMSYCTLLAYWIHNGTGYQGDLLWLYEIFARNCGGHTTS